MASADTEQGGNGAPSTLGNATVWDLARVVVVVAALVYLTVFLVRHYTDSKDAISVLGVVVPVFAAAFGVTLGYYTGNQSGKAQGAANKEQAVKNARRNFAKTVQPLVQDLETRVSRLTMPLITELESPRGEDRFLLRANQPLNRDLVFSGSDLTETEAQLEALKRLLDAEVSG